MNLYELNAFVTLSKTLHFAKAAEEINLSASALSRIITRLEEETGTDLIDRSNRKVELTPNGKLFAEFAKNTTEQFSELKAEFSGDKNKISGTLHVYASVTACYVILPLFIKKLSEKYPGIQLSVETGDPAGAIAAVPCIPQSMTESIRGFAMEAIPGLEQQDSGFMQPRDLFLHNTESNIDGIFYAGTITSPKSVGETLSEATSVAHNIAKWFNHK